MILLTATTDKLQVVSGQAGSLDVHVSFMDMSNADPPVVKGSSSSRQNTAITTATTTDVLAAPAASTLRNAKTINIRNKHASITVDVTVVFNQNGTSFELHKATLAPGDVLEYIEGVGWFEIQSPVPTFLMKVLTADDTGGQNVATAQPWFPTQGALTVQGDTTYQINAHLYLTRAAGTTSHTTSMLFGGTATITSIQYQAKVNTGDVESNIALNRTVSRVATATVVKAASTSATETISMDIEGIIRINAGGTLIPQFQYSVAPGGAPTVKANSNFRLDPLGNGSFQTSGVWS